MKTKSRGHLEDVKFIFDQEAPSSPGSSPAESRGTHSSHRPQKSPQDCWSSSSESDSSSSRSRPRSHCSPQRYRAHSRSISPSRTSRSRQDRTVGQNRRRFSRSSRSFRSRSRSAERSAICFSRAEKKYLLAVAQANAARILGVQSVELPASLKNQEEEVKRSSAEKNQTRAEGQAKVKSGDDEEEETVMTHTSPKRKTINIIINNATLRPCISPALQHSEVVSGADRKPYGQWMVVRKAKKHR